jgi:lysophospholipase L1-like esterase
MLITLLHSHKPISAVVICLGANDLKMKFSATHQDVVAGIKLLIRDVQRCNGIGAGHGQIAPKVLVLGPPVIHLTPTSTAWGFPKDVDSKSKKISALLAPVCRSMGVGFLNLATVSEVSMKDGIHFDDAAQERIAKSVNEKLLELYREPE